MVGSAGSRSSPMRNVQPSTNLYCRQQAPPMRRYVNDGATQTLAAPANLDTRVDPTKLRISRDSNMLGATMPFRDPVKRRTSRVVLCGVFKSVANLERPAFEHARDST